MTTSKLYMYVTDTLADWEPGYVLAELSTGRYFKQDAHPFETQLVGASLTPVRTLGGVGLTPDVTVDSLTLGASDALLLPGSNLWLDESQQPVLDMASKALDSGITVGAICGATMGLANAGVLDDRRHTSNALEVLTEMCPKYQGSEHFVDAPAVSDRGLVTASGTAPLAFAHELFSQLDVFEPETLEAWHQLNRTGEAKYFYELMQSLPQDLE